MVPWNLAYFFICPNNRKCLNFVQVLFSDYKPRFSDRHFLVKRQHWWRCTCRYTCRFTCVHAWCRLHVDVHINAHVYMYMHIYMSHVHQHAHVHNTCRSRMHTVDCWSCIHWCSSMMTSASQRLILPQMPSRSKCVSRQRHRTPLHSALRSKQPSLGKHGFPRSPRETAMHILICTSMFNGPLLYNTTLNIKI